MSNYFGIIPVACMGIKMHRDKIRSLRLPFAGCVATVSGMHVKRYIRWFLLCAALGVCGALQAQTMGFEDDD
ncbi:MAG: hypothetical protein ACNA71_10130, partial [Kiritimatiellia bacterium]